MKFVLKLSALALGALSLGMAEAHHSVAAFDLTKVEEVKGTVKTLEWTNPHAWVWVMVPDAKGGSADMGFECASLTMLRRGGWTRDVLKPGDKVTIKYHPMKDGKLGGQFVEAELADGHKLGTGAGGPPPK